jgi:site-specific recombinase XerD
MAGLKKRGKNYYIVFSRSEDGKQVKKTYSLGTTFKKIAEEKKVNFQKLYDQGEIDPFQDGWSVKAFEDQQKESGGSAGSVDSYFIDDLKEEFLKTKAHTAAATRKAYKSVIKLFIEEVGRSMTISLIRPSDIRNFCFKGGYSNATQRNYYKHLKVFFSWVSEQGIIDQNPCDQVIPPKKKDKLVDKIFSESELEKIFEAFRKHHKKCKENKHIVQSSLRQHWFIPLITTCYYTGLRRKEITQLKWHQVDFDNREISVTDTKNGRERTVILFDKAYESLKDWNAHMGKPQGGFVFPSPKSNEKTQFGHRGDYVSKVFKSYVKKAKLKESIHFHGLRHSCATFMIRKGFDVTIVKEMLGHRSIEVTMRYVSLAVKDHKNRAKELGLIT